MLSQEGGLGPLHAEGVKVNSRGQRPRIGFKERGSDPGRSNNIRPFQGRI